MKLTVFTFYKDYLGVFDPPMFAKEPMDAVVESYRRSILSAPDQAYQSKFQEITLVELGKFDDFEGKFELLPEPKSWSKCSKFFPAGFLAKKETPNA